MKTHNHAQSHRSRHNHRVTSLLVFTAYAIAFIGGRSLAHHGGWLGLFIVACHLFAAIAWARTAGGWHRERDQLSDWMMGHRG